MADKKTENKVPLIPKKREKMTRDHRLVVQLNEKEYDQIERYCLRHNIANKSDFVRRAIYNMIWQHIDDDYPTLF